MIKVYSQLVLWVVLFASYMFSVFSLFQNFFLFWFSRNIGLYSWKPATGSLLCTDSNMYFSFLFIFSFWNLFAQLIQFITLLTHYYPQLYSHHLQGFWFEFVVDSNPICKSKENANCLMNYISFLFFSTIFDFVQCPFFRFNKWTYILNAYSNLHMHCIKKV